ncbi:MAG: glycosyltransferase [Candidatus Colwellbacteria bacterium]
MRVLLTGYTYASKNLFEVFESYPEKENLYFILPNNWQEKEGRIRHKPFKKEGFNIWHSRAFFFHSNYPVIGGLFKGLMPFFIFRFIWLRFTAGIDILYTNGEVNLLATLYNAIWAKMLGVKHICNCWENIPYEQKDRGIKLFFKKAIIRANLRLSNGVLCGMKKAEKIVRSFDPEITIGTFLHAGLNEMRFKPGLEPKLRERLNLENKFVLLFVGVLGYRKGVHIALESLSVLRKKYDNLHFIIVGSGEYEEKLKLKIKDLELEGLVTMIPWMENKDLPEVLNSADLFLYPSIPYQGWEEQFGYSIAEASLCGLPVISTKSGSIDEVLIDGRTGLAVSPNNTDELTLAIERIVKDPELGKRLGRQGRDHIVKNYSNGVIAGKLLDLFKRVGGRSDSQAIKQFLPGKSSKRTEEDTRARYVFAAKFSKDKKVLDISCGSGYGTGMLKRDGLADHVDGVDISESAIDYARSHFGRGGVSFYTGDITSFGEGDKYELITCFETMEQVQDYAKAFDNLYRVLKPGGVLLLSAPNRRILSPQNRNLEDRPLYDLHIREFTPEEMKSELEKHGFTIGEDDVYGSRQQLFVKNKYLRKIYKKMFNPSKNFSPEFKRITAEPRYFIIVARKS